MHGVAVLPPLWGTTAALSAHPRLVRPLNLSHFYHPLLGRCVCQTTVRNIDRHKPLLFFAMKCFSDWTGSESLYLHVYMKHVFM